MFWVSWSKPNYIPGDRG